VNLGLVLAAQNRFTDASTELNRALAIEPEHLQALTALGMVQTKLGHAAEGVATFARVTKLNPSAEAFLNLGIAHADQSEYERALDAFAEAVKLAPQLPAAHYNRGRALFDLRRYDEAIPELARADTAESLYLLALAEKQIGQIEKSVSTLRSLIAKVPNNSEAHYYLGQNLNRLGQVDEAIVAWKRAFELNDDNSQALYALVRALAARSSDESKRYQGALEQLQKRRHLTDRAEMLNNLALASAEGHDWEQAINHLREALEICDGCRSEADLHKNLGLIYCRSGDLKRGAEQLHIAQKMKPNDPDVEKALAVIKSLP
jgi:tetratricopeptide (TPR) repeat protein